MDDAGKSTKKARVVGTPIKKGQVLNPTGRPKTPESVKQAFSGMMPLALDALRNILNGTDTDARPVDRLKAADMVFDRNLGRPLQAVDMKGEIKSQIDVKKLTTAQMDALTDLAILGIDTEKQEND